MHRCIRVRTGSFEYVMRTKKRTKKRTDYETTDTPRLLIESGLGSVGGP